MSSIEFHYLELSGVDANKAYDPDNFSPRIFKECANFVAPSLTLLFKKSFASGYIPTQLETSKCCASSQEGKHVTCFKLQTDQTFMYSI